MVENIFLGWNKPFLWLAAEHLLGSIPQIQDLSQSQLPLLVFPSKRSERRCLELIARLARSHSLPCPSYHSTTIDKLSHHLIPTRAIAIGDLDATLLWRSVLQDFGQDDNLKKQLGYAPTNPLATSRYLHQIRAELALEGRNLSEVYELLEQEYTEIDREPWELIARLESEFIARLKSLGLDDLASSLLHHINNQTDFTISNPIYLISCPILPHGIQTLLLRNGTCSHLISAPEEENHRFGPCGDLLIGSWLENWPEVTDDHLRFPQTPYAQAKIISKTISELQQQEIPLEHISIGLLTPEGQAGIQLQLEIKGIPSITPGVNTLIQSQIGVFISKILGIWAHGKEECAPFLRSQIALIWIEESSKISPSAILKYLDSLRSTTTKEDFFHGPIPNSTEKLVRDSVIGFLETLSLVEPKSDSTLEEFCKSLRDILNKCFSCIGEKVLSSTSPDSIEKIIALVDQLEQAKYASHSTLSAKEFKRFIEEEFRYRYLASKDKDCVRIFDWGEVLLDDSPYVCISHTTSATLPKSRSSDPLLPNSLRTQLNLSNNRQTQALDNFTLHVLLNSKSFVQFFCPKLDEQANPCQLSKLLLLGNKQTLNQRLLSYYSHENSDIDTQPEQHTPQKTLFEEMISQKEMAQKSTLSGDLFPPSEPYETFPLKALSATHIRDYLLCPYSFYLSHILKLRLVDYTPAEVPVFIIGSILHQTFQDVGINFSKSSILKEIQAYALENLYRQAKFTLGKRLDVSTQVQLKLAEAKLISFCKWFAENLSEGWTVVATEKDLPETAQISIEGYESPIRLSGRVDWIEYRQAERTLRIIDFKTGDKAFTVSNAISKDGLWREPQLGFYATYLNLESLDVNSLELDNINIESSAFGYLSLGKGGEDNFTHRIVSEEDRLSITELTKKVATHILNAEFWPPSSANSSTTNSRSYAQILERRLFGDHEWEEELN